MSRNRHMIHENSIQSLHHTLKPTVRVTVTILCPNIPSDIYRQDCVFTLSIGDNASRVKVSSGVMTFSPYLHTNTHTGLSITATTCAPHNPILQQNFYFTLKYLMNKINSNSVLMSNIYFLWLRGLTGQCFLLGWIPPTVWSKETRDEWRTEGEERKRGRQTDRQSFEYLLSKFLP